MRRVGRARLQARKRGGGTATFGKAGVVDRGGGGERLHARGPEDRGAEGRRMSRGGANAQQRGLHRLGEDAFGEGEQIAAEVARDVGEAAGTIEEGGDEGVVVAGESREDR